MIRVESANRQKKVRLDRRMLARLVRFVLKSENVADARISVVIVDDPLIHQVNRDYLKHDYPTDVITFPLSEGGSPLVGEIVASADHAVALGPRYGHSAEDELLLYVIHGLLHLVGHDDKDRARSRRMAKRQKELLQQWRALDARPR